MNTTERLRAELIERLGGKCTRCPEADRRVLQFDHVRGGGAAHRRLVKGPHSMMVAIRDSLDRGEREFQILCANCNWKKRFDEDPPGERAGRSRGYIVADETRQRLSNAQERSWRRPDARARREEGVRRAWDAKTAEELAKHGAKISAGKAANPDGLARSIANLTPMTPEILATGTRASADARRGVPQTEEHRAKIAAGLARAYAEGRRRRGHSAETKARISATKRARAAARRVVLG